MQETDQFGNVVTRHEDRTRVIPSPVEWGTWLRLDPIGINFPKEFKIDRKEILNQWPGLEKDDSIEIKDNPDGSTSIRKLAAPVSFKDKSDELDALFEKVANETNPDVNEWSKAPPSDNVEDRRNMKKVPEGPFIDRWETGVSDIDKMLDRMFVEYAHKGTIAGMAGVTEEDINRAVEAIKSKTKK